jgi:hypothetical protein
MAQKKKVLGYIRVSTNDDKNVQLLPFAFPTSGALVASTFNKANSSSV